MIRCMSEREGQQIEFAIFCIEVVRCLAERAGLSMEEALKRVYESREYRLVSRGSSDQHCMTPDYIVDDILAEAGS